MIYARALFQKLPLPGLTPCTSQCMVVFISSIPMLNCICPLHAKDSLAACDVYCMMMHCLVDISRHSLFYSDRNTFLCGGFILNALNLRIMGCFYYDTLTGNSLYLSMKPPKQANNGRKRASGLFSACRYVLLQSDGGVGKRLQAAHLHHVSTGTRL